MLLTIGRSPRWLVMKARIEEAREALLNANTPDLEAELQDIVASVHLERQSKSEPLLGGKYRLPIFLAVSIAIFNQLTGINAIIYYMNDIFRRCRLQQPLRRQAGRLCRVGQPDRNRRRHLCHR